jgi:2-methylisocitrate lyase-like PEP mutase family enzyme
MSEPRAVRLQELIHRLHKVLAVLHPPSASHARIMEKAGCEALFVGTGGVVGAYTGLADVGTAPMSECITIAGWIADSVSIPVMVDGDTGHGGIMAVRRLIRDSIRAGLAGIRIDDQPIEGKRKTQNAGIDVVPLRDAVVRYRAAVDMKNELDPNFVVMAQSYARDATGGTLDDTIARLRVQALRPPRPLWQDRRGEADLLLRADLAPIADLGATNPDRPDAGLDCEMRPMTVTHDAVATVR